VPRSGLKSLPSIKGIQLIPVSTIKEAIFKGLVRVTRRPKESEESEPELPVEEADME